MDRLRKGSRSAKTAEPKCHRLCSGELKSSAAHFALPAKTMGAFWSQPVDPNVPEALPSIKNRKKARGYEKRFEITMSGGPRIGPT